MMEYRSRTSVRKVFAILALPILLTVSSCGGKLGEAVGGSGSDDTELTGDITFVVPTAPGGGFDTTVRTLAPYLEKNLPEGANIVVQNLPGGNGAIAINEVMSAEPNGRTIGIFNIPGYVVAPLIGDADYDLTEVEWLGLPAKTTYVAAASPASGVETLEDLQALSRIDAGVEALTSTSSVGTQIAMDDLGLSDKANYVSHQSGEEARLSAIRGDTDIVQFPYGSLREHIVDSDDLTPLWVYSDKRLEELPDTPTFQEVGGSAELLDVITLYRPIGTTPGTPPEILKTLRTALAKAMQDPELLKKMREARLEPQYEDAARTAEIIRESKEKMKEYRSLFE